MFKEIKRDLRAVVKRDPATKNKLTAALTSSGFHALVFYRFAHVFFVNRWKLVARLISQLARFLTGVEIHPGATIGSGVVIDHGSGVVIGETAEVGNDVLIYQGVTLGGTGKDSGKRHPTIEDGVMISAGAKVLGPFTVGKCAKIGAGSIVLKEVPPYATVVGVPGRVVKIGNAKVSEDKPEQNLPLDQSLPDPVNDEISQLLCIMENLNKRVIELEKKNKDDSKK